MARKAFAAPWRAGGLQLRGEERGALGDLPHVHLPENSFGPRRRDAHDDPFRREGVRHCRALTQELGVPCELGLAACAREFRSKEAGCANGDSGFPDDQAWPIQQRGKCCDAPMHLGKVGVVAAGLRRGASADEVHVAECRGMRV